MCRTYGEPDTVALAEVPSPALTDGQVRVLVRAAAVNFPDVLLIADRYQLNVPTPFIPGSEFAGVVSEISDGVTGIAVGDRVTGTTLVGAFAEQVVVSADALHAMPPAMDDRFGAASGVAHRTAYHVLRSVARVQPGEQLVVLGAGGGVGLAAVQLGVHLGAVVTAVASSPAKLGAAAAYGATHLIDHRSTDLRAALRATLGGGSDVVLDPVGGELSEPALRSLRWGGRFVTVGYAPGVIPRIPLNLVLLKGCQVLGFQFVDFARHSPKEFERDNREFAGLMAEGRIVPHVGAVFALADVVGALHLVASGQAVGKVVLEIGAA